jgi:hypothetical protein
MRMGMRRLKRLTNGFSKKVKTHVNAVSRHFAHYNSCRVHKSMKVKPAMAVEIADHDWSIEELVSLMAEPVARKPGPYKARAISN